MNLKMTYSRLQKEIIKLEKKLKDINTINTSFIGQDKFVELLATSIAKKVSKLLDQYLELDEVQKKEVSG